jgi:hypothetical protein
MSSEERESLRQEIDELRKSNHEMAQKLQDQDDQWETEINGYETQKEKILKDIELKKAMIKSLDKKIKAVKDLIKASGSNLKDWI